MTATKALWASNSGHITCAEHGGRYFIAYLEGHPRATRFVTPLDAWERFTPSAEEQEEWLREFGTPIGCESCPK